VDQEDMHDPYAPETHTVTNVKVTNKNAFDITDRYDGVPYVFKAKSSLTMPADAALHVLGWFPGVDDAVVFNHLQRRWGYNTPQRMEKGEDKKVIGNIAIEPIVYRLVPVTEAEGKRVAAAK